MNKQQMCQVANQNTGGLDTFSFIKMHGCGNDYVFFDCFDAEITAPESVAVRLSDRHKGIGSDGIVLMLPSETADAKMRMFKPDGSESSMYGNAIRCVGKYLYESGRVQKTQIKIETLSGIKICELILNNGCVTSVCVDMGAALLKSETIPVKLVGESVVGRAVNIEEYRYEITCVNIGEPHAVIFDDDIENFDLPVVGPLIEKAEIFPKRVNFEVANIISRNNIKMRVWERGAGETMACGAAACAVAVAACLMGYCDKDTDINIQLKGGTLTVKYTEETVYMTGDCEKVFEGTISI